MSSLKETDELTDDDTVGLLTGGYEQGAMLAARLQGEEPGFAFETAKRYYNKTGNPLFALMALLNNPTDRPLPEVLQKYLNRSLRPLIRVALDIATVKPEAMQPADAVEMVAEWLGLRAGRGKDNAFGLLRIDLEAEKAAKAIERHMEVEGKENGARLAAGAELGKGKTRMAELKRRAEEIRSNPDLSGLEDVRQGQ